MGHHWPYAAARPAPEGVAPCRYPARGNHATSMWRAACDCGVARARPVRRSRTQTPCWGFRQAHGHESARTRAWRPTHLPVTPMAPPARAPGHKGNTGRYL